jgi:23S rRNA (uracil1939-C5)-methyltransferase
LGGQHRLALLLVSPQPSWQTLRPLLASVDQALGDSVTTWVVGITGRTRETDQAETLIPQRGPGVIRENLAGYSFMVSPNSFFQVNTPVAEAMVRHVQEGMAEGGNGRMLDFFCGAGTFSLSLAGKTRELLGFDSSSEAIADARRNAQENQVAHARFEVRDLQKPFEPGWNSEDCLVLDPPRSGLPTWLAEFIATRRARRMALIACDPASLARDCAKIMSKGVWRLEKVQPFDLFPQTGHVESVAWFQPA